MGDVSDSSSVIGKQQNFLPGLIIHDGDPTVENLSRWICEYMSNVVLDLTTQDYFDIKIDIEETKTNGASWEISVNESI
jgi:hypothetical protein